MINTDTSNSIHSPTLCDTLTPNDLDNIDNIADLLEDDDYQYACEDGTFYDELFFCYICKSIFVSKQALEDHQSIH